MFKWNKSFQDTEFQNNQSIGQKGLLMDSYYQFDRVQSESGYQR